MRSFYDHLIACSDSDGRQTCGASQRLRSDPDDGPQNCETSGNHLSETVRKGFLGRWLGTLPSMMRRAYPTDLSDVEWACLEPYLPTHAGIGRPRLHSSCARSSTPSSTSSVADVPGACCRTSFRPGRLSITTSEFGASTVPGSDYTLLCAIVCEYTLGEILNRVRA